MGVDLRTDEDRAMHEQQPEDRLLRLLAEACGGGAGQFLIIAASLQLDFADLDGGLGVGVVGDIGKDRLRVRGEGGLKGLRQSK
jgi:hypothetical protein